MTVGTQTGFKYVIPATGVLTIDQDLSAVHMSPINDLSYVDVSGSLQVNVNKNLFAINNSIDNSGNFTTDSITVTAQNILSNLISVQDVGYLSTMYQNYNNYVNAYFGNTTGFSVTFTTDMNSSTGYNNGFENGAFTKTDAFKLMQDHLTGQITLSGLTELLRYICLEDPFKNRNNYGLYEYLNGFVANDLVYFKSGVTITLHTEIDNSGILIYSQNIQSFQAIDNSFNKAVITDSSGNVLETLSNTDLAATELLTSSSPAPDNVAQNGLSYTFNGSPPVYNNKTLQMSVNIPVLFILN